MIIGVRSKRLVIGVVLVRPIIQLSLRMSLARYFTLCHGYLLPSEEKIHTLRCMDFQLLTYCCLYTTKTKPMDHLIGSIFCRVKAMKHRGTTKSHTQLLSQHPNEHLKGGEDEFQCSTVVFALKVLPSEFSHSRSVKKPTVSNI